MAVLYNPRVLKALDGCSISGRGGGGRQVLEGGGGGGWDPKVCVPKMARPDFPNDKFPFFPQRSLWPGGRSPGGVL